MTWHAEAGGDAGLPVLASLRDAGRGGVGCLGVAYKGCRFAQPLATGWDGSAIGAWLTRGRSASQLWADGSAIGCWARTDGCGCACGGSDSVSDSVLPCGGVVICFVSRFPPRGHSWWKRRWVLRGLWKRSGQGMETRLFYPGEAGLAWKRAGPGWETRLKKWKRKMRFFVSMGIEWLAGVSEHRQGACFIMGDAVLRAALLGGGVCHALMDGPILRTTCYEGLTGCRHTHPTTWQMAMGALWCHLVHGLKKFPGFHP